MSFELDSLWIRQCSVSGIPSEGISTVHSERMSVSLGCLPSSRFSGSILCSLTPATSCGSANKDSGCVWWCVGSGRGSGVVPRRPNCVGPLPWSSCLPEKSSVPVEQGLRQLGLRDRRSGEPQK